MGALPREGGGVLMEKEGQRHSILTESHPWWEVEPVASGAFLKGKVQSYAISTY